MRNETPIELPRKAFELLTLLVENHGRLLTKEEIMERIWADSFVEESNLPFTIGQLRRVLGDDAQKPKFIKTVRQHGYRFIASVNEIVEKPHPMVGIEEKPLVETIEEDLLIDPDKNEPESISKPVEAARSRTFSKFHLAIVILVMLLISTLAAAWILTTNSKDTKSDLPIFNAPFKAEKLTNTGGVLHAVISPDGKRMAYTSENGGKQGIWIRKLETSENVQILGNSPDFYGGLNFSHDGEMLYFSRIKGNEPQIIYRVSSYGGIPKEIVTRTEGWFSLSPDDRQISFVRCPQSDDDYCSLYVSDSDGKNERRILTRSRPIRIGDNQFSPDGKSIAVAIGQSRGGSQEFSLVDVDVRTNAEHEISRQKFFNIQHLDWLPDKSGLLFTAADRFFRPVRIHLMSYPSGEIQTLNSDPNNYNHISLDKSAQKMIATQYMGDFRLWVAPTTNLDSGKAISYGSGKGVFTKSGSLVFSSTTDGTPNIWTINADGTNQRQLTSNQGANMGPRVSPDERFIYFHSNRTGAKQVWRMNMDGSNQIPVSDGEGGTPVFVSPDGNTVFYVTAIYSNLSKVTIGSNGELTPVIISKERLIDPEINPAGDTVAYFSRKPDDFFQIVLMSVTDGKILKNFDLGPVRRTKLEWSADGKSLFYLTDDDLKTTIWQLALETGKPEKFTELNSEDELSDFAFSADGKTMTFIRGKWRHDAVLIEGLK